MSEKKEKVKLGKKPTWWLFVSANFSVVLGCAITWILFAQVTSDASLFWIPTLVCNMVALILCGLFIWLEVKDIGPKLMHFQKKWLGYYVTAFIVFVVAIIFNALWFTLYLTTVHPGITIDIESCWPLLVHLLIPMVLTLVSIGLQRYARFKIDLDIYRRQRGTILPENQPKKDEPKKEDVKVDEKASGGLIDQMDKK